jgi:hypothetical protein
MLLRHWRKGRKVEGTAEGTCPSGPWKQMMDRHISCLQNVVVTGHHPMAACQLKHHRSIAHNVSSFTGAAHHDPRCLLRMGIVAVQHRLFSNLHSDTLVMLSFTDS